ncbi:MAG: Peptidoglycan glycosyltransferase [Microgenomates group bacterium GW2011_GWC2_45_8]|nr:MAG: Peptidoglycan glycosyltransferase [Microgenomates group bacterium GW2011_GWC2_45_8]KKU26484.1 MAG: Peptidoglycan glycosyltransferase [Microgenomates group bacterium GW2011_GWA2_46_16]
MVVLGIIILRLSYWQVIRTDELASAAQDQYLVRDVAPALRGSIVTADGYPIVINQPVFALGAYTPSLVVSPTQIVEQIMPLLDFTIDDPVVASDPAKLPLALEELKSNLRSTMLERITRGGYAVLVRNLSVAEKATIETLSIPGLTFDPTFVRQYPEASMSAQLTGFVGRDDVGKSVGYFGLEGFYDRELSGRERIEKQEKDAFGNPLLIGDFQLLPGRRGRDLKLFLERGVQYLVEQSLQEALAKYGAVSGEVIVMDPSTGGILAMASLPSYEPTHFHLYDSSLYKNPAVANTYEPGSTFKVLVMAAAFNEEVIQETDQCDICGGPYPIGKYTIKTWNNEYHPLATPQEILVHSDNVGMVWTQQKLGGEKLLEYLKNFGLGQKTGIDLQEEVVSPLRTRWGDIDYATASFGQGIAVTSIQMLSAVGAIANKGVLMEPHLVQSVIGDNNVVIPPKSRGEVISSETSKRITNLMIQAVEQGEAQWAAPKGYTVAGKTGTAQIAVSGHYDAEKTIASFVGFAPASNPRFVMLVKLREPQSSQWGSETAAPLWFSIAKKLLLHYNIPPDKK